MGCLRPFGTSNHIRQHARSHPHLFIDWFIQRTALLCFLPLLQRTQPSETVLHKSSPLASKLQTSTSNMHLGQCSSFSLMEPLACPAVSRHSPTHQAACPISHTSHYPCSCIICWVCFLSTWAVALPQQDSSLGGEVKPPACSPTCPWGPLRGAPSCCPSAPKLNPATHPAALLQTHMTTAFKLGCYQV